MTTIEQILQTFNKHQKEMFDILNKNSKYQFRVPTGVGKGYVMIAHILNNVINTELSKFVISSHRLSLNNQHLRDLINLYIDLNLISKVKFLSVGSQALNINKLLSDDYELAKKFNNQVFEYNFGKSYKMSQNDIFKSTLTKAEVNKIVNKNTKDGFKTIIISTYNSLDKIKDQKIDIIYLDEAHILATEKEVADFKSSYESINSTKRFFFTATPKDVEEQLIKDGEASDIFLMNNTDIFGDIYEIKFIDCVQNGYITKPIIHIAYPTDFNESTNYDSVENKTTFIKDTFKAHEKWLKSISHNPTEIEPKVLVRCESVKQMWCLRKELVKILDKDIIVCAGASYNDGDEANHIIGNKYIKNRDEWLKKLQDVEDNQKMIILNFDIMSEGINISGITGVLFLQGKMPSIAKVIQNIGRTTRLHPIDRNKLKNGEIKVGGENWIKPHSAVIIPYWDAASEFTKKILADVVRKLRDSWEFDPHFVLSVGDDFAESDGKNDIEGLNNLDKKAKKAKLIDEINQEIEKLDLSNINDKEEQRIASLSKAQLLKEKLNIG